MSQSLQRARSIVGASPGKDSKEFYQTPVWAIEALLDRQIFHGKIWEPACGNGAISKVLNSWNYNEVISTDLNDYGYGISGLDFLGPEITDHYKIENIITNPPFSLFDKFLIQGLKFSTEKLALFGKLAFLEGIKRKSIYLQHPPKVVYVFSKRVKLEREGQTYKNGGMMAFAWFVWDHAYNGKTTIEWI